VALSQVQHTGATSGTPTVTKAFASNLAVGNLVVVCGMRFSPSVDEFVAGDVTQSAGTAVLSTFSLDKNLSRDNGAGAKSVAGLFSATVLTAGSCTIQLAGGLSGATQNVGIAEFHSDAATSFSVEASNTGNGASGNAVTGSSSSAGAALFVGCEADFTSVATAHTEGAGYSLIYEEEDGLNFATGSSEYQIVSTGTTDTADWTIATNAGWAAVLAVYKEVIVASGAVIGAGRIPNKFVGPAAQRFLFRQPPLLDTTVAPPTAPAVMPPAAGTRLVGPPALRRRLARPLPLPASSQSGPNSFTQALTATLDFVGSLVKSTAHTGEAGALSFAGALVKRTSTARTATLSFAGSLARSIGKVLTGALSFAGARAVSVAKALTGTLSFAGSVTRAITLAAKTATLNFVGALVKSTATARTATLSFSGSVLTGKAFLRAFTATLSFSGAFAKLPNKALAGTLSFAGSQSRAIVHTLSAALSFAGSQARRITLAAKTATLSFAGSLAAGHLFTKALTATLSFAGAASRRAGKALAGSLAFVGARGPTRIGKALTATLGSSGVLARVTSAVQAVFGWGARGRVGGAAASDPFQRVGSESARDPWQRIGSESADDPFQRIGSESAKAEDDAIGGESAQGTPGKIGSDEA
jgi:hypothetical protein